MSHVADEVVASKSTHVCNKNYLRSVNLIVYSKLYPFASQAVMQVHLKPILALSHICNFKIHFDIHSFIHSFIDSLLTRLQ